MEKGIDVTTIENFENAEAESLRAFIKAFRYEDGTDENKRLTADLEKQKKANDNLASENAEWKRKYAEKLTNEEKAALQRKEAEEKKDALIAELQRDKALSEYKAKYTGLGYAEDLAEKAAAALFEGKTDELFRLQTEHMAAHDKEIRIENLKGTPTPPAGTGGDTDTFGKLAEAARANGDLAAQAYYLRLAQQQR